MLTGRVLSTAKGSYVTSLYVVIYTLAVAGFGGAVLLFAGVSWFMVALVLAALMARHVFQFDWQLKPWVPLVSAALGALLAWGAGWWSLRGVLQRPVVQTLREAQAE